MKQQHQWVCAEWTEWGRRPAAQEWKCIQCEVSIDDGSAAESKYCYEEDD